MLDFSLLFTHSLITLAVMGMKGKIRGFVALIIMLSGSSANGQPYDTIPNDPAYYNKLTNGFRSKPEAKGRVIFLGNSITEGGNWFALDSLILNRGISGDNTFGVLARLDEVIRHKPSKVFLLIGVNDLSKNIPPNVVMQNIFLIVGRIRAESSGTEVFVQSLLPVNPTHKNFPARFNKQADIETINAQLKKYAEALHYIYVDLHSEFLDGSMRLNLKYTTDGLHLNRAGYSLWGNFLKKQKWL